MNGAGGEGEAGDDHRRLVRASDAVWRNTLDGVLALSPADESPLFISGSAVELWFALEMPIDVVELWLDLAARFDADPSMVRAELLPMVTKLVNHQLVVDAT